MAFLVPSETNTFLFPCFIHCLYSIMGCWKVNWGREKNVENIGIKSCNGQDHGWTKPRSRRSSKLNQQREKEKASRTSPQKIIKILPKYSLEKQKIFFFHPITFCCTFLETLWDRDLGFTISSGGNVLVLSNISIRAHASSIGVFKAVSQPSTIQTKCCLTSVLKVYVSNIAGPLAHKSKIWLWIN